MLFLAAVLASVATLSVAKPLPADSVQAAALVRRADFADVTCPMVDGNGNGQVTYTAKEISDAFLIGTGALRPPPDPFTDYKGKTYPKEYRNDEGIPLPAECMAADIRDRQEHPILRSKVLFGNGSRPGPDRVIFARKNDGNFVYCYTVYHQNGSEDGAGPFAQCT